MLSSRAGVDVLGKRGVSCPYQGSNPRPSSHYDELSLCAPGEVTRSWFTFKWSSFTGCSPWRILAGDRPRKLRSLCPFEQHQRAEGGCPAPAQPAVTWPPQQTRCTRDTMPCSQLWTPSCRKLPVAPCWSLQSGTWLNIVVLFCAWPLAFLII